MGFSNETFALLDDLKEHRDKAWFEANRKRYETSLLEPLRAAVTWVGPRLREVVEDIEIRPQVNKTLTRINRDMRFARGQSPYKDHMLALFYREGRKREDAQLFLGLQGQGAWCGLYAPTPLLSDGAPIARALASDARGVVATARAAGVGGALELIACRKYGEIDRILDPSSPESFTEGPHLCAREIISPKSVMVEGDGFCESVARTLLRLVPLWRLYCAD